jgi:hypothetical protein
MYERRSLSSETLQATIIYRNHTLQALQRFFHFRLIAQRTTGRTYRGHTAQGHTASTHSRQVIVTSSRSKTHQQLQLTISTLDVPRRFWFFLENQTKTKTKKIQEPAPMDQWSWTSDSCATIMHQVPTSDVNHHIITMSWTHGPWKLEGVCLAIGSVY